MPNLDTILVALDFSPHGDSALELASELAAKFDAKVSLLHVLTLQEKPESALSELHEARLSERRQLDSAADAQRAAGHLGEVLWREGDPAWQIVLSAKEHAVDLIVLGASGRTGMTRLLLGSVAESVTKNAPCSVMVVRNSAPRPASESRRER